MAKEGKAIAPDRVAGKPRNPFSPSSSPSKSPHRKIADPDLSRPQIFIPKRQFGTPDRNSNAYESGTRSDPTVARRERERRNFVALLPFLSAARCSPAIVLLRCGARDPLLAYATLLPSLACPSLQRPRTPLKQTTLLQPDLYRISGSSATTEKRATRTKARRVARRDLGRKQRAEEKGDGHTSIPRRRSDLTRDRTKQPLPFLHGLPLTKPRPGNLLSTFHASTQSDEFLSTDVDRYSVRVLEKQGVRPVPEIGTGAFPP